MSIDSMRDLADAIAKQEASGQRVVDHRALERLAGKVARSDNGWYDVYREEKRRKGLRF